MEPKDIPQPSEAPASEERVEPISPMKLFREAEAKAIGSGDESDGSGEQTRDPKIDSFLNANLHRLPLRDKIEILFGEHNKDNEDPDNPNRLETKNPSK